VTARTGWRRVAALISLLGWIWLTLCLGLAAYGAFAQPATKDKLDADPTYQMLLEDQPRAPAKPEPNSGRQSAIWFTLGVGIVGFGVAQGVAWVIRGIAKP
jgi:hypothetical protein